VGAPKEVQAHDVHLVLDQLADDLFVFRAYP